MRPSFGAVVVAGGNASRLGGTSKGDVIVGGRRMVDWVLDAVAGSGRVSEVVVVGEIDVPGIRTTMEDPPKGGPAAGLLAGVRALSADAIIALSCDIPGISADLPTLLAALSPERDGAVLELDGRTQWLSAVYWRAALEAAAGTEPLTGMPLRELLGGLDLARVPASARAADVDTWEDVAAAQKLLSEADDEAAQR